MGHTFEYTGYTRCGVPRGLGPRGNNEGGAAGRGYPERVEPVDMGPDEMGL